MKFVTMYLRSSVSVEGLMSEDELAKWVGYLGSYDGEGGCVTLGYKPIRSIILRPGTREDVVINHFDIDEVVVIRESNVPERLAGYQPL